jgi:hypothetical protein
MNKSFLYSSPAIRSYRRGGSSAPTTRFTRAQPRGLVCPKMYIPMLYSCLHCVGYRRSGILPSTLPSTYHPVSIEGYRPPTRRAQNELRSAMPRRYSLVIDSQKLPPDPAVSLAKGTREAVGFERLSPGPANSRIEEPQPDACARRCVCTQKNVKAVGAGENER